MDCEIKIPHIPFFEILIFFGGICYEFLYFIGHVESQITSYKKRNVGDFNFAIHRSL